MIRIFYVHHEYELAANLLEKYLRQVPKVVKEKVSRFYRWQDRQASLFGRLILNYALENYFNEKNSLQKIQLSEFGRPFIKNSIDFNISHSGTYVCCAITEKAQNNCRLGIDIELIRKINIPGFKRCFTDDEWTIISRSNNQYDKFFKFWTIKESVMKANGKGLSIPMKDIIITNESTKLYDDIFYIYENQIDSNYKCHVASNFISKSIVQKQLNLSSF